MLFKPAQAAPPFNDADPATSSPPENLPNPLAEAQAQLSQEAVAKRLKRHLTTPLADWRKHDDETWVVTGYFDFWDTLISLAHAGEEAFGLDVPDPWAKGHELYHDAKELIEKPKTTEAAARKLMRDALDFVDDPRRAVEDRERVGMADQVEHL